ncbi:MAG: FkbM family methyltransferase [Cyclobacteriaceae bacterium]|nr:FkbM family methyltransferase [Cyclobacteriaceae bacterium]
MFSELKRVILNKGAYFISRVKLQKILKKVDNNTLFVDCGANKGDISDLFLNHGAKVIAFEPDPLAYRHFKKRFSICDRIKIIGKAVSDEDGTANIYLHKHRKRRKKLSFTVASSLLKDKKNVDAENKVEVETIDLSSFIKESKQDIDIIKLDVEGAEIDILNKIIDEKTYNKVGLFLVETHEKKIPGHDQMVADLKKRIEVQQIDNIKLNWI